MMRLVYLICFGAALVAARMPRASAKPGSEWRTLPLVEGRKIHADWVQVGLGGFVVEGGTLRTDCSPAGWGLLVHRKEKFGNCQIKVVYRCKNHKANSGVFVRLEEGLLKRKRKQPAVRRDKEGNLPGPELEKLKVASKSELGPWYAVHHGYEIQIQDDADDYHRTGSIYSLAKTAFPRPKAEAKGELGWKEMIITLDGDRIEVAIDGKKTTRFDPAGKDVPAERKWYEPKRKPKRPQSGYLGLQNHDPGDVVYFKEVSVRPLRSK